MMVVCRYFLQGVCRFGENCRNDHVYSAKYSYQANQSNQLLKEVRPSNDDELVYQVKSDAASVLRGGQWILSGYTPFKEKPGFPGLTDVSPEEARLMVYEANVNNQLHTVLQQLNNLYKEAELKYKQLAEPSPEIVSVIRKLFYNKPVSSPFNQQGSQHNSNQASSLFKNAVQSISGNNSNSLFGQNNSNINTNENFFTQHNKEPDNRRTVHFFKDSQFEKTEFFNNTPTKESLFNNVASVNQNSGNVFGPASNSSAKSIFAQAKQEIFGPQKPSLMSTDVSQNIFSSPKNNTKPTAFSSRPSNIFQVSGQAGHTTSNIHFADNDNIVYSQLEVLSVEDRKAFEMEDFMLGCVPEMPPPKALCF